MSSLQSGKRFRFFKKLGEFSRDRSGLSTLEYALAASLIAAATIVSVGKIGVKTSDALMGMNASINGDGTNNNSGGGLGDGDAGDSGSTGGASDGDSGAGASAPDNTSGKKKKKKKKKKRKKKGKK